MPLDIDLEKTLDAACQDIVRILKDRSLYRVANAGGVLENLSQRMRDNSDLEELYQDRKAFIRQVHREAHFAFFEEAYKMLRHDPPPKLVYQELARYSYRRAITYLYDLVPQYVSSTLTLAHIEFTRIALVASQETIYHIHKRMTWTGGIARPTNFYSYVNRTIRKQCADLLFQEVIHHTAAPNPAGPSSVMGSASEPTPASVQVMFPPAKQRVSWGALLQATRRFEDTNERSAAVLALVGLDYHEIAAGTNQSDQESANQLSRVFAEWSSNSPVMEKLHGCFGV
jgi:hypothetical protein